MSAHSSEIVVGVDFGTTHSGVSWAVNGGSKVIRLINNWPDPLAQNASKDKVPSSISYVDGKPQKWGYSVGLNDESFRWIKVLLEENHKYATTVEPVKDSNTLLRKVNKTAQAVVADYLRLLWDYTLDDIKKFHPDYQDIYALRVVLTVPAIWSPTAKDKTLQAARIAGMPGNIRLVTEPEAAALATLKDKAEDNTLKVGDAFVVCDAGGGTVDLISYEVERLKPLKIKECAIGSGGLCGSVFLDLAFQKYIETIVGEIEYNSIKENNRKKMMREFEYGIKRCFSENNDQTYSVDLKGVKDDPRNGVIDDTITVKIPALRAVFDHISLQIENLVSEQIAEVSDKDLAVKAILLVGGFGENRYLYDRLVKCHAHDGVQVMQVNGAWSSICRGATLWGLEHSDLNSVTSSPTVVSRLSRYSYGVAFTQVYDPTRHLSEDVYLDTTDGTHRARGQMEWLLKRGEVVEEGRMVETSCYNTVEVGFRDSGRRQFSLNLYYNEETKPPTRKTSAVYALCTVNYSADCDKLWLEKSFKSPITKKKHRRAKFDICIILGNATLDFTVAYKDELVGHVEAKYMEEFK
ncbi:hypothetical protein BDR22DRAFT_866080 [Usnea florida]